MSKKEKDLGLGPPSEPQVWIGAELRPVLPLMTFPKERESCPQGMT